MKIKKLLFTLFFMIISIIVFSNNSYAGSLKWNSLNYDVTVNSDGSMDVVETWDIKISEINTVFKQFNIDKKKYSEIDDIEIIQISPNRKKMKQIYEEQKFVDKDCFYALKLKENPSIFEIAWHVGLEDSSDSRTYEVHYTVNDVVKIYNDCTELYWMFLDTSNQIPAEKITGKIKLPRPVEDIENLRIWGHGPLNAIIEKESEDTVVFQTEDFPKSTMFEVRIVTEENIYLENFNEINKNMLDEILSEEQKWADEANAQRLKSKIIWIIIVIIIVCLFVFFLKKIFKYKKIGSELKQKYQTSIPDIKYFRDIPDEKNATPARAAYLYYFKNNVSVFMTNLSKIFSATILDFALKGIFTFEPIDKKNLNIIINENKKASINLSEDEQVIYDLIKKAAKDNVITTKELSNYAKINYEKFNTSLNKISELAIKYQYDCKNIDKEKEKICKKWSEIGIIYIVAIFLMLCTTTFLVGMPVFIELIICCVLCFRNSKIVSILSEKGMEEEKQWKGLKNYMDEFSLLKEKEVPDLILWEKFLVYATTFGISKKVLKQLKVVYPEMGNPDYYSNKSYSYMYYMSDSRFGDNFLATFDNMMETVYNSYSNAYSEAHSASSDGSGGGGGFSGGGGGGGGGGRMWWSLILKLNK